MQLVYDFCYCGLFLFFLVLAYFCFIDALLVLLTVYVSVCTLLPQAFKTSCVRCVRSCYTNGIETDESCDCTCLKVH